jgi:iron complex outermembrane receptor protein
VRDTQIQRRFSRTPIALAVCIFATAPAWADQATPATESGGLEEIVVTARKASESLQTTPVAVSAFTTATLSQQQIFQVDDLQRAAPDVAIGGGGTGPSTIVYLAIRGEGQNSPNSASDNASGVYVDGVYIGRPIVGNQGFLDVGHVEVLRGPQGTLFGRNTTGGALTVTSNQPTDKFEGHVSLGYGNYNSKLAEFVVNVPIDDQLSTRFALRWNKHDPYYLNPGQGGGQDGVLHDYTGRASIKWTPTDIPLVVALAVDTNDLKDTGTPSELVAFNNALPFAPFIKPITGIDPNTYVGDYTRTHGDPKTGDPAIDQLYNVNKATGFALNVDFDIGASHVKFITGYRQSATADSQDLDATPVPIASFVSQYRQHQFSEELQISGKIDKFDLIGGVYHFNEGGTEDSDSVILPFLQPYALTRNYGVFQADSRAGFLQTNYHVTDTVRITAGYRYTWDRRDLDRHGLLNASAADPACGVGDGTPLYGSLRSSGLVCNEPHEAQFSYPAWTIGADWQVTDQLFAYVKSSKADMAGGFNTRPVPPTATFAFAPESNKDVEVGLKADLLDRHLRTNVALFHAWQANVQRVVNSVFLNSLGVQTLTQYVANSGKSETYGAELEITALPWTGMEMSLSAAYLHAAYVNGTFKETQIVGGVPVVVDRSGEPVPQAPKYTLGFSATQTVPMPFGNLQFHGDWSYRADTYYTYDTPAPGRPDIAQWNIANNYGFVPSYSLLNAKISLNLDHPNVGIDIWGRNLASRHYYTQLFNQYTGLGVAEFFQGDPRTFGVTATYNW